MSETAARTPGCRRRAETRGLCWTCHQPCVHQPVTLTSQGGHWAPRGSAMRMRAGVGKRVGTNRAHSRQHHQGTHRSPPLWSPKPHVHTNYPQAPTVPVAHCGHTALPTWFLGVLPLCPRRLNPVDVHMTSCTVCLSSLMCFSCDVAGYFTGSPCMYVCIYLHPLCI